MDFLGSFTRLFSIDTSKVAEKDFSKIAVRPLKSSRLKRRAGKKKERKKEKVANDNRGGRRPLLTFEKCKDIRIKMVMVGS